MQVLHAVWKTPSEALVNVPELATCRMFGSRVGCQGLKIDIINQRQQSKASNLRAKSVGSTQCYVDSRNSPTKPPLVRNSTGSPEATIGTTYYLQQPFWRSKSLQLSYTLHSEKIILIYLHGSTSRVGVGRTRTRPDPALGAISR
jgi:hypothetical protein